MAVTFPSTFTVNPQNLVQGPTRFWYAPYVASGADASQGAILEFGAVDKSGLEFDHKMTFSDVEADQFLAAIDTFHTKDEFDIKATFLELSAANLQVFYGMNAASLATSGGVTTLAGGDPFDIGAGGSVPSMRPKFYQVLLQFPSPGHDNTTNPIGAWAYLQFWKCAVVSHSGLKLSKDGHSSAQVTWRAYEDMTVTPAFTAPVTNRVFKLITQ